MFLTDDQIQLDKGDFKNILPSHHNIQVARYFL